MKLERSTTGRELVELFVGKREFQAKYPCELAYMSRLTITEGLEEREHQGLVVRNRHKEALHCRR